MHSTQSTISSFFNAPKPGIHALRTLRHMRNIRRPSIRIIEDKSLEKVTKLYRMHIFISLLVYIFIIGTYKYKKLLE